ncbi:dihydrodipicolinate synthase family protein [Xanthobacteraceae bacterium Astr-EGSB]|uniref:dihydrodipicolinate synthase family protein n=1 Tax=Astrobacterium formosum TaxID=3069710 RepID=UPI0027B43D38|nr:dihydrodipicolinate synthase family protein [Xanthobacteraceae bacterium Astr-EGSB]
MSIKGSLVPNITLFDADGRIDAAKTRWHMEWMFAKGVDGLFLTGSYGAGPLMSNEERVSIYKLAKQSASGFSGKILFPHVGCIDTNHAVALAKAAEAIGVDAIGAVPPYYYKHTDDAIVDYYRALIQAVKLPVFAYNNPETSRYTFNLKTVQRLQDIGLAGMKDSPLQLGFISQVAYGAQEAGKDFQFIAGTSTGWLPLYHMGVRAMIGGMNNWAPEIMTELVRATFAGEWDRARKAYLVMMQLSAKLHFTDSTIASHMALYARGFDAGFPRRPMLLPKFGDPKYAEVRADLEKGFAELGLPFETGSFKPA